MKLHRLPHQLGWTSVALTLALSTTACLEEALPFLLNPDASDDVQTYSTQMNASFTVEGDDFYRLPWPMDNRLDADGFVELDDFPKANNSLIAQYLRSIESHVKGFSTMQVSYVRLEGIPDTLSVPSPAISLNASSPIQLINVSEEGCGDRIPVESLIDREGDDFVDPGVLAVAPVPGFPLEPNTPYSLVILRGFGNSADAQTERPAEFEAALTDDASPLYDLYRPVVDCLPDAGVNLDDVAVATIFTTQDPVAELEAMLDVVRATDAPQISDWEYVDDRSQDGAFVTYRGTFSTPIFQTGTSPYAATGGDIRFDDDGVPIIQRWEDVPMTISIPDDGGSGPYPVLVWEDGTGATLFSHIGDSHMRGAVAAGYAVAAFEAQFHGDRATPNSDPELHTFNYLNPNSFRSVFRQQVADTTYFIRVLREATDGLTGLDGLDPSRLVYGGHSQGAIVGAITAGVETEFMAYGINGIGGYLSVTLVERKDPIDINAQIGAVIGLDRALTRFHLIAAMAQLGGDVADPINYAPRWRGWEGNPDGSHMFLINGRLDHTTPEDSVNSATVAGRVYPMEPSGWNPDPFLVADLLPIPRPVTANSVAYDGTTALTMATYLDAEQGHFTIYNNSEARNLLVDFWESALEGAPVLPE
ncbi:MAG: hypothetical protein KC561_06125 [Myxococcales bacterium]|nr:hypothetical protein [Myxococcales bacterium]